MLITLTAAPALAGGLFLPGHGVRGLGRGGAFTAGGDDPGGIWYNPANIGGLHGVHALLDGSLILFDFSYQRVDSGGRALPAVENEGPLLPIPTIGLTYEAWKDRLVVGLSVTAPNIPVSGYRRPVYEACPASAGTSSSSSSSVSCLDTAHGDAPQRYSLLSMEGSLLLQLDLAVALRIIPQLTVGVSLHNVAVSFLSDNVITTYNGVTGNPEDPEYDAVARIQVDDYVNPTVKVGLLAEPIGGLRIGASVVLPVTVREEATVNVQLPVSPLYANSRIEGQRARFELKLPMVVRGGVEVAPVTGLRLEVGVTWERWSVLDAIRVEPIDIVMYDIPSIDRYQVPALEVGVGFRDTTALHLGGEYDLGDLLPVPVTVRGGYMYERGAAEDKTASVLAWDNNKHALTVGASLTVWGFRLDVAYAHVFIGARDVGLEESRAMQVNPIRPDLAVAVGAGHYEGSVDILGLGVTRGF